MTAMIPVPDFSEKGYQVIEELGYNYQGGRITYKAIDIKEKRPVVIKCFQFIDEENWSGYQQHEQEIKVLKNLSHSGIPLYLDSFKSEFGFCLVQEYKAAQNLSQFSQYSPEQIKTVALNLLDILIYLQTQIPPIIHRDVKPENILVDEALNVYLIDFGLARIGGNDLALSSVAAGTFGFMAPEQIYNKKLTTAADIYGLGSTLICLATHTKSTDVEQLIDETGRFDFELDYHLYSRAFYQWLKKLVNPKLTERFASANLAKEALVNINVNVSPDVVLSQNFLDFQGKVLGEILSQTIKVKNLVSTTLLHGEWQVIPHLNDPPEQDWIHISSPSFHGNFHSCNVEVDTSQLLANKVYHRQISLTINNGLEPKIIEVTIKSGKLDLPKINDIVASLFASLIPLFFFSLYSQYNLIFFKASLQDNTVNDLMRISSYYSINIGNSKLLGCLNLMVAFVWFLLGIRTGLKHKFYWQGLIIPIVIILSSQGYFCLFLFSQNKHFIMALIAIVFITSGYLILGQVAGFLFKETKQSGLLKKTALKLTLIELFSLNFLVFKLNPIANGFPTPSNIFWTLVVTALMISIIIKTYQHYRHKIQNKYKKSILDRIQG
ncbi:MAG: serine/threonine-protein kinase [Crocosphaera sp.]|nr:serine/threonine-protein kinase [Crocosphaera sp.]